MATYKYRTFLAESQADIFDDAYEQGSIIFHSGIYRCLECDAEIAIAARKSFPPCGLHVSPKGQSTHWRLLVQANQNL